MRRDPGDIKKSADFLLRYRKTPHATTNEAPAMLLMKRIPRSRIDLCQPQWRSLVEGKQEIQKEIMIEVLKARSLRQKQKYGLEIIEDIKNGVQAL